MSRDTYDLFAPRDRGRFGENEIADTRTSSGVNGSSDILDLKMVLHAETHPGKKDQGAILASDNGDESRAKWMPKSLVEFHKDGAMVAGTKTDGQKIQLAACTVTLPQWLACDKGLI